MSGITKLSLLLTLIFSFDTGALAQHLKLLEHQGSGFSLSLSGDSQTVELNLTAKDLPAQSTSSSAEVSGTAFAVENPWRIVMDLDGIAVRKNITLNAKDNPLVKSVRLGAHSDKLRIVVDLVQEKAPVFSQSREGDTFRIVIKSESADILDVTAQSQLSPVPESPTPSPVSKSPIPSPLPTNPPPSASPTQPEPSATATTTAATATAVPPTATSAPVTAAPSRISNSPTPQIDRSLINSKANVSVRAIEFDYLGPQKLPIIKIELNKQSAFKLEKQDERTYALSIPESALAAEYLALAQFPPHDFVGFTHLACNGSPNGVTFKIGVERGVKVSAFSRENEVIIKTLNK